MVCLCQGCRVKGLMGDILAMPGRSVFPLLIWLLVALGGCSGIRYSEVAPAARDFHPRAIALLSLDVVPQEEARAVLDRLVTKKLTDKGHFQKVLSADIVQGLFLKDETLRQEAAAYLGKLEAVNFSDSDLSREIGRKLGVDALLLVNLDYWYYTKEAGKNAAKVGMWLRLINAESGLIIWKAGHDLAPDYVFMKPDLSSIAADVVKQMIGAMPH